MTTALLKDWIATELTGEVADVFAPADVAGSGDDSVFVIVTLATGEKVVGECLLRDIAEGATYKFFGRWRKHHKHGNQFHFDIFVEDRPHDQQAIVLHLSRVKGIGEKRATALWNQYGHEAIDILRDDPMRVAADEILPGNLAVSAADLLREKGVYDSVKIDLHGLLAGRGFQTSKVIDRCVLDLGRAAFATVKQDPFCLLKYPSCGFKRCDRLYLDLGHPPDALKRQMLCAIDYMSSDTVGHTWHRGESVVSAIKQQVVGGNLNPIAAIQEGIAAKKIAKRRDEKATLFLAENRKASHEYELAAKIKELQGHPAVLWPAIESLDTSLTPHQRETLSRVLAGPVGVLTGTPGTGKTFATAAVIKAVVEKYANDSVAVCAPTGKAAIRCTAAMRNAGVTLDATTIHRLLGINDNDLGFRFNRDNPLAYRFVVVDESSMLDASLASSLFQACRVGTHVLLVGDVYQLPPVGHGAPLRDIIFSSVNSGELTEIRRNSGMIVEACAAIKDAKPFPTCQRYDPDNGQNVRLIEASTAEDMALTLQAILDKFRASKQFDCVWEVQVLVAVNSSSPVSRVEVNSMLQDMLNKNGKACPPNPFRVADKVICLKNTQFKTVQLQTEYDPQDPDSYRVKRQLDFATEECSSFVANGEIGKVLAVSTKETVVQFDGDRIVKASCATIESPEGRAAKDRAEDKKTKADLALAYAITGHKSQGSEWPCVIVIADKSAKFVASRNWYYTAISRASRLCIILGQKQTVLSQCHREMLRKRKTFLTELLNNG